MSYSPEEIIQYVEEEDVKFIRLVFCDRWGVQKNISVMPSQLPKVFSEGIQVEAIGLDEKAPKDEVLYLHPDVNTLALMPWRPDHGRVIRMFCAIKDKDGQAHKMDYRSYLEELSNELGPCSISTLTDFTLYRLDENGTNTDIPYDQAGYLDIAPLDKCENMRRAICLTLETMGVTSTSSGHSYLPGQNRISYESGGLLQSADNMCNFQTVVHTMAAANGLWASFDSQKSNHIFVSYPDARGIATTRFSENASPYLIHLIIGLALKKGIALPSAIEDVKSYPILKDILPC